MAFANSVASPHGVIAALTAPRLVEPTGVGQYLDLSMFESMFATTTTPTPAWSAPIRCSRPWEAGASILDVCEFELAQAPSPRG